MEDMSKRRRSLATTKDKDTLISKLYVATQKCYVYLSCARYDGGSLIYDDEKDNIYFTIS